MSTGAHTVIYSRDPEADRAFLRDVLKLTHVDVGHGWLIFGLPPAEVAVHPAEKNGRHAFYLMCDDVEQLVATLTKRGVTCGPVQSMGWGRLTEVKLPGGGKLGIYQPRHARPKAMTVKKKSAARAGQPKAKATRGERLDAPRACAGRALNAARS